MSTETTPRLQAFRDQFAANAGTLGACGVENVGVVCSGAWCAARLPAEGLVPIDYAAGTAQTILTSGLGIPRHTVPCLAAGDALVMGGVDMGHELQTQLWVTARCILHVAPGSSIDQDDARAMRATLC